MGQAVRDKEEAYRYEELAEYIVGLAEKGALRPGARAPSLRQICKDRGASLSTALRAYQALEDRGVLEARPRSGYYVAQRASASLATPAASTPPPTPVDVSMSATVLKLLEHASNKKLVPLGCAIPSPDVLAAGRLDRCLARAARTKGLNYNVYSEPRGDLQLRQEIIRRALRSGWGISPDDIAITNGCTEALALALSSVAKPGDTIAIEAPTYFGLLHLLEAHGLRALELPTDPVSGVDLAALERALRCDGVAACLFSSSFNNPLGSTMPDSKKIDALRLLAQHDVPLIEDDVYGDIYFRGERPKPFAALDPSGRMIYCSSFSKTIAPGYRIGWLASPRYVQTALEQKLASTLANAALPQAALAEFLSSGGYDGHLRRIRSIFADNIDRMTRTIAESFPPGTRISRPAGGFVLWVELAEGLDGRMIFDEALKRGICFAPGDVFSARGRFRHCLRLSCGYPWDRQVETGVRAIGGLAFDLAHREGPGGAKARPV